MLKALSPHPRVDGDSRRRWYFSQLMDLVVWFDESDNPVGFQLAYDKQQGERSLAWHAKSGYQHYRVDEGALLSGSTQTPLLNAARIKVPGDLPQRFADIGSELPAGVREFVSAKLDACVAQQG